MKILNEDRIVKFGGKVHQNTVGASSLLAPGSGKSTAFKERILAQTKKFDPDDLKMFRHHDSDFNGEYFVLKSGQIFRPADYGIKPPYDLTNPDVTSKLHELTRPIRNSIKKQMLSPHTKIIGAHDDEKLPNISFDITGSDIEDVTEIVESAKSIGYKVGIVWVLTEVQVAFDRRVNNPKRRMNPKIVIKKHLGVLSTLSSLVAYDIVGAVDDFWILLDEVSVENLESNEYDEIKVSNVFHIENSRQLSYLDDIIASDPRIEKYLKAYREIASRSFSEITELSRDFDVEGDN